METYLVKNGDTILSIAKYYNIPASIIISANNLKEPYNIKEGDILNIPTGSFNIFDYYTVKENDTLYKIANIYNTDVTTLSEINGLNVNEYIYPNQVLLVPKSNVLTYITKEGDTLSNVLDYFKTDIDSLLYNNNNIYLLPDQLLVYRKN